jgi:inosose dehydratase
VTILDRVAAAPISWAVCEVPGWGHQMEPERVLAEMEALGLRATELGPEGFLPVTHANELLREHGLAVIAGFVPAVLHVPPRLDGELWAVRSAAEVLSRLGAEVLVLAASSGRSGYDRRERLDPDGWRALRHGMDRAVQLADEQGLRLAVHPHQGTVIERPEDVDELLRSGRANLCLDTGHVAIGGGPPRERARAAAERGVHVHLKDVDLRLAERVAAGDLGYRDAVKGGLYRPLGDGDLDVIAIVRTLEEAGYGGWYVLEHDEVLDREPLEGAGPIEVVRRSLAFLERAGEEVAVARDG